ncbi:MAG: 30S ribosomal protein S2 [Candidatus Undinarchaeales archaeon]
MTKKSTKKDTLVPLDKYLATGIHIGTQRALDDMDRFIYKTRPDGLAVLDVSAIDERLETAAKFLARFKPEKIMVVSGRDVGKKPARKFAETIGAKAIIKRFMPGSLTNPAFEKHIEPEVLFVVDPGADKQAVKEAINMNIPIVSLVNSNNMTQNIDLLVPVNNRGKKSLALIFWILAREVLKARDEIKDNSDFTLKVEDFQAESKRK